MTKKAASLLLAASLAVSVCAMPVFADENMGSTFVDNTKVTAGIGTGDTKVIYKVTESYQWSIPATIDFGENAGANNTSTVNADLSENEPGKTAVKDDTDNKWKGSAPKIVVSKNVIGVGKKLQITINTTYYENDEFYVLTDKTNEKLFYTITKPAPIGLGEPLTKTNNEVLSVPAGTYASDQELVFTLTTAKGTNVAEKAGDYEGHVIFQSKIV